MITIAVGDTFSYFGIRYFAVSTLLTCSSHLFNGPVAWQSCQAVFLDHMRETMTSAMVKQE